MCTLARRHTWRVFKHGQHHALDDDVLWRAFLAFVQCNQVQTQDTTNTVMNTTEPSFSHLLDWIEGRLSEQDAATIAAQVASASDKTRALATWLRAFNDVSARATLKPLPSQHHQELLRRFKVRASENQQPSLFRRLLASLTFDSGAQLAIAGVRALNGLGNQRQMVFSTEAADVVINTQPSKSGSQLDVLGQVMPTAITPDMAFVVQLLYNETEFRITQADDMGEFSFEAVPPGNYDLVLSNEQLEIHTATIEMKLG
ncbi:MAG: hypothetical protein HC853_01330 [Anaerolineae bacterium]|nr:hypothetical protein [Anaerolineae bacterium]